MTKRFLLDQKISRRISPMLARVRAHKGFAAFRSTLKAVFKSVVMDPVRSAARFILGAAKTPYIASSMVVVGGVLAIILCLTAPKPSALAAQEGAGPTAGISAAEDNTSQIAGGGEPNRESENQHTVTNGETLSEIAAYYGIKTEKLAAYNRITLTGRIKEGSVIRIPSKADEARIVVPAPAQPQRVVAASAPARPKPPAGTLKIMTNIQQDGLTITAHFTADYLSSLKLQRFEWTLGDGKMAFQPETYYEYQKPGTYTVTLKATDADGNVYTADQVIVDVPHPTTQRDNTRHFLTLDKIEDLIKVTGTVTQIFRYEGGSQADPAMLPVESKDGITYYRASRPGYFGFDTVENGVTNHYFVFVSPIDSKHSDNPNINWYRTQFNTGTMSNCGPTSASMAISWATGEYVPVSTIRTNLGWFGNGSTSYADLMSQMAEYHTSSRLVRVSRPQDIMDIIDRGNIVILLYNTKGVRPSKGPAGEDLLGTYYIDDVGHYLVIKGYSRNQNYFVVYDAIPSDWSTNSFRYSDGISMIGRNRYYSAAEVFKSMSRSDVIEVMRPISEQ